MENRPQVFISYRGKDLRLTLVPHLNYHLKDSNVNVFTDANITGERLKNLFNHIKNSRIVIVIFSVNYLESRWCLDELSEIKNCLLRKQLDFVIPIFYKVRTFQVQKQSGDFGKPFLDLQKKHPHARVMRWKKALKFVAKTSGLSYKEDSSISELDFIMKVVETVNGLLRRIALKDSNNNNNTQETSMEEASNQILFDVNQLNELLLLSKTSETLNLERFFLRGFMFGFAWKDLISSMQSGNSFEISPPANYLQFHIFNGQSFNVQGNESLEKAINLFALHMVMYEQTKPSLIFSNWNKLDQYTKKIIIYSAQKKCQMLKAYNEGVDLKSFLSPPVVTSTLEPMVPQDCPHHEQTVFASCISFLCRSFKRCLCLTIDDPED